MLVAARAVVFHLVTRNTKLGSLLGCLLSQFREFGLELFHTRLLRFACRLQPGEPGLQTLCLGCSLRVDALVDLRAQGVSLLAHSLESRFNLFLKIRYVLLQFLLAGEPILQLGFDVGQSAV